MGDCTGISFVDSTPIRVCNNKRIRNNKVFKGIATTGKSTMGWFHGFKLHIIINDKGEILNFTITQANVDDRTPLKKKSFLDKIYGKLFADKGCVGKAPQKQNRNVSFGFFISKKCRKFIFKSFLGIKKQLRSA